MSKQTSNKFSPEVRSRAVRLVVDHAHEHPSRRATIVSVSAKIGCTAQTLLEWVRKAEIIHRRGPWRSLEAFEFATLEWNGPVQQPAALGAHRQHPAGRSRGTLLRHTAA